MFNYKSSKLNIAINRQDIYSFGLQSAIGKTYLADLLRIYSTDIYHHNLHYAVFNDSADYDDFCTKYQAIQIGSLVILDRLDFFFNSGWLDILKSRRHELYTLVDFKRSPFNYICEKYVTISIKEGGVNIYS